MGDKLIVVEPELQKDEAAAVAVKLDGKTVTVTVFEVAQVAYVPLVVSNALTV